MPTTCSAAEIIAGLKPGMTVYVPGVSGESLAFYEALRAAPQHAAGVRFVGAHFPGINRSDYLGLHVEARQRSYFMLPGLRAGFADGRAELLPLDYPGIHRDLSEQVEIDLAIAQLTPPDAAGQCSTGLSADFLPAVWAKARRRVAHFNPRLPRTTGSFSVPANTLDAFFEADHALVEYDSGAPSEAMLKHGALVAGLVRDGDTLEFGVGKLQAGILKALGSHRDLKVWSGMASSPVLPLLDAGVIRGRGHITLGVALGDAAFYERVGRDDSFHFRPVSETHDVATLGGIRNFCAINSAVEVDLFGQTNADSLNGKLVAGVGGLPAFVAGALRAEGGRSIIALPAATDDGRFSRITLALGERSLTALPRHMADYVVTEYGIAALRGLGVQARAAALIAIAAPAFRESLARQWAGVAEKL
ncbi:MAG: acetyl-CoA hydrolase/transferase C-terminal domain-containing protein [Pseudomonadota bacterium]